MRVVAIGCALGLTALALFATLHAIVVKPVWGDLVGGIPFVIAVGVIVTWAYHEFAIAVPGRVTAAGGVRFGALMWLSALPATALANIMRYRTDASFPAWFDWIALALALCGGTLALWLVTKSRRAALAGALAAAILLAAGGGPLPVVRGGNVVQLWIGLLVLETMSGAVLAAFYRRWAAPRNTVILQQ
ncbi:MAG: hypothetical protein O2973_08275 [Gemmatimonadetes bacterium]|nr:hypothetical protein [Gemmatimonadota bacterium]